MIGQLHARAPQTLASLAFHNNFSPIREWEAMIKRFKIVSDAMMKCHYIKDGSIIGPRLLPLSRVADVCCVANSH